MVMATASQTRPDSGMRHGNHHCMFQAWGCGKRLLHFHRCHAGPGGRRDKEVLIFEIK